jgi:hypothetical protein
VRASTWAAALPCPGAGGLFVVVGWFTARSMPSERSAPVTCRLRMVVVSGATITMKVVVNGLARDTTAIVTASSTTDADSVAAQFQLNIAGLTVSTSYQLCVLQTSQVEASGFVIPISMATTATADTMVPTGTNIAMVSDTAPARLLTAGGHVRHGPQRSDGMVCSGRDVSDDILRNEPECGVSAPPLMPELWCTSLRDEKSSTCRLSRHRRICVQLSYPFATACTARPWSSSIHAAGRSGFGVGGR